MKAMVANLQKSSFTLIHSLFQGRLTETFLPNVKFLDDLQPVKWTGLDPTEGKRKKRKNETSISAKRSELNSVKAEGFSALWTSANQLLISSFHIVTSQLASAHKLLVDY